MSNLYRCGKCGGETFKVYTNNSKDPEHRVGVSCESNGCDHHASAPSLVAAFLAMRIDLLPDSGKPEAPKEGPDGRV